MVEGVYQRPVRACPMTLCGSTGPTLSRCRIGMELEITTNGEKPLPLSLSKGLVLALP